VPAICALCLFDGFDLNGLDGSRDDRRSWNVVQSQALELNVGKSGAGFGLGGERLGASGVGVAVV
jgi:hypothetical protein